MTTTNYPNDASTGYNSGETTDSGSSGAREKAQQATETAAGEAKHVGGVAQGEAKRVASEATSQLRGLMDEATSQVDDQSRQQKDRLAGTVRTFGDDLDQMSSQGGSGLAGEVTQQVAHQARTLASRLEAREPRELLQDVRDFARRKPGTFLLGALAAGVVTGRLTRGAKAAQSDNGNPDDEVMLPVQATSSGYGDPTLGGTSAGAPLAGTGAPTTTPAYTHEGAPTDTGSSWTDVSDDPDGARR